jgi:predicted phosphodiesterase
VPDQLREDIESMIGVGAVRDLIERSGIDPAEIGRVNRVKVYQGLAKVQEVNPENGELVEVIQVQDMAAVELSPKWADGPSWPVVQPGPPQKLPPFKVKSRSSKGLKTALIVPDIQAGFYHNKYGELVSTHDDTAVDLMLAMATDLDPDLVVLVGDNADLPEMGKYRLSPAFHLTTQATINWLTTFAARMRAAAPRASIVWLAGNHEERLVNYILDNAAAAFGIRQGNSPEGWPVLSIPHLCRLDESGVEYLAGYPANQFWINERLRVVHGHKVRSGGSTAHAYLNSEKTSVLYGHIHRREWAERTFEKWDGAKTIMAATPGCLAKVDGSVPSTKGGIDLHGRPLTVVEDWQQGIGVVQYDDTDSHEFWYQQIPFHGGRGLLNGKMYSA